MAWADTPDAGVSVIAVADRKERLAEAHTGACDLAGEIWNKRAEFRLDAQASSIDETIEIAKAYPGKPVFISDSGDNITGGAAGDIPLLVERLISLNVEDAVVGGILDPGAVAKCREVGLGSRLKVNIGGKIDRLNGKPLGIEGEVANISDDGALVRTQSVEVILTTHWQAFTTLEDFRSHGIDPLHNQIIVVKQGYLLPELRRAAAFSLLALSPGFTNLQLGQLDYKNVRKPIYPLDGEFSWEPPRFGL